MMVKGQRPHVVVNESRHEERCHDGYPSGEELLYWQKDSAFEAIMDDGVPPAAPKVLCQRARRYVRAT